jgi:two-component system cell cycle response regulator
MSSIEHAPIQPEYTEEPTDNQRLYDAPSVGKEQFVLTILTGSDAGAVIELHDTSCVLGRDKSVDIRIDCHSVSRVHARLTCGAGGLSIEDLGSRNGTWVEGTRLYGRCALTEGQRITLGNTVMRLSLLDERELASAQAVADAARKDPLTGCFNRGYFDQKLHTEVVRTRRRARSTSLVLVDLDHFKRINDKYGHVTGDAALRAVGQVLRGATRVEDVVARYGGEEFAVIVPGATSMGGALLAQRVRTAIEKLTIDAEGEPLRVTASLGVASLEPGQVSNAPALLRAADGALYAAKHAGRNRVHIGNVGSVFPEEAPSDPVITVTMLPERRGSR